MIKLKFIILVLLTFSLCGKGFSQSKEQEKMAKEANSHFKKGEFLVAEKFYSQLAASNPQNPEYNYKYGACLLKTAKDKGDAVKYLKFAVKNSTEVNEAHYYYAKSLQYTYRFKEALKNYNAFRATIDQAKADKLEVDAQIKQCKTSLKLIEEFSPVKVITSKVMNRQRFEKAYRLSGMRRKVLVKPSDFKTKEDFTVRKKDPQLIVHGKEQNTLFFSGYKYGNRFGILEKDIYMVKKDDAGLWTNFLDVGPFLNSDFDEAYPYLHPNGRELYFSSKGHGGLGGYDIFKSNLDTVTGLWGKPTNLGFAVNSAFDDILYVIDQNDNVAYFSSNRANSGAEITVYKIFANNNIDNYVLFKGKVTVEGGNGNLTSIEVFNADNYLIGTYKSDASSGDFIFPLAELESYKIRFTYDDKISKSTKLVTPLKSSQEVIYKEINFNVSGTPSLEIETISDYTIDQKGKINAFQNLANLSVNQNKDVDFGAEIPAEKGIEDITAADPESLLKDAELALEEIKEERKELSKQINAGYIFTHMNTKDAVAGNNDLQMLNTAPDAGTPKVQQEIQKSRNQYEKSIKNIVSALEFTENQEKLLLQKDQEESLAFAYVEKLNEAKLGVDVNLVDYRKKMARTKKNLATQNKIATASKEIKELKNKRSEIKTVLFNIKSDIALINDAIEFQTKQMNDTKKDKERQQFAQIITSYEKSKKKKSPVRSKKKAELQELDSLLKLKENELSLYGLIDAQSGQSSMKRLNLKERETIVDNARITINKTQYAGKLDKYKVRNVLSGSEEVASTPSSPYSGTTFSPSESDFEKFMTFNLNDANDEQIKKYSTDILGVNHGTGGTQYDDAQIEKNEQLAANNFREALMMRQEIEKKKKQLAETTDEKRKAELREEIKILEDHLFEMEFQATQALSNSNDLKRKEKNTTIELAFLVNPEIKVGEIAQLYEESNKEWDEITMLKQRIANVDSKEEKSNISKEILQKQQLAIEKLVRAEKLIKGQPLNEVTLGDKKENTSNPINFNIENEEPARTPVTDFSVNSTEGTNEAYQGVNIDQYGPNSTMRVKKGLLISSDIKYTMQTKVPIDIPLGTGVIYKVQVGAFRNKINPAMFNGITPLSGEDAGNGIIRYTAGIFKSLTGANRAKGKIVDIGYSDAFVVAFFNGKRISLSEAENVIKSSSESQLAVYNKQKSEELAALDRAGIKSSDANISRSSSPNPINRFKSTNILNSGRIRNNYAAGSNTSNNSRPASATTSTSGPSRSTNTSGVYFTVQIGVYSTPKTSADMHGISPLVTHTNARGLIRYSTGIFKSFDEADQRKAEARAQGADDAYVVAYRDGIRISVEEARGN